MVETRILGDYTLIKQVGQGSMGPVFLAEHRFMKKQYILKILPEELSSDRTFVQRFEEDVAALTSLEHPHIVKIHTVSFSQGQYFLVTDCVVDEFGETTNLAQYMLSRGKRFDEETLFRLLRQVAEALDYAHGKRTGGKGTAHRNLKLNNILVAKGRGGIDLTISDFGLTRIIGPGAVLTRCYKAVAESLGVSGALFGAKTEVERYANPPIDAHKLTPLQTSFLQTFSFLAPEQKRHELAASVGTKVDVYAFGVLAYYLLVGDFPEGMFEMPSKLALELTWNWDSLIGSCLQQNPTKRPDSLVAALDNVRQLTRNHVKELVIEKEINDPQVYLSPKMISLPEAASLVDHVAAAIHKKEPVVIEALVPVGICAEKSTEECLHAPATVSSTTASSASPTVLRPIIRTAEIERPTVDLDPGAALLVDTTVKQYTPERREVKNIQPLLTDMVVVPGGAFKRGSMDGNRDEMPRHPITLPSYAIDTHPVTNEQFVRFLEVMGGEKDSNHQDIIRMRDSRIKRSGGKLSIESGYSKHPVVGVTWYGAVAYAKWVGKRLPTEAEWEVAARGGLDNELYPYGDDIEKTQANFFSSDTTAVMSYAPNSYGLYDVVGNVYEWCHDWYGYNYYEISVQEPDNPKGPLQGVYRVLRGGCWKSLKEDLRCSRRHRNNPGTVNGTYGFRCAADVQ
ncbi:MAG: bifunctional serine/threonine-protein kinase/formylglycine-generating enzyme family protein [Parachlamydiaceae bacterium]